nr:beta-1,6-N-acetylglucosaminyltransferase [Pseudaestuariivita rosea]
MLVHTAFDRAEQIARHWANQDCPVAIHVDSAVAQPDFDRLQRALDDLPNVTMFQKFRCEWGTWGLVAAGQMAGQILLDRYPDLGHVLLSSGSCLPLRPVSEFRDYLSKHPTTDFIESASVEDVPWTMGGLHKERFTLYFPFSWKQQRWIFDRAVQLQRRLGIKRKTPSDLVLHLGSQWWCLTAKTLSNILHDDQRAGYDRYFSKTWIPDESYFQTLVRKHSKTIESRSLTLSKFDFQGKPHIFYDDHLPLLRRSDCFIARKIWPAADRLYREFLAPPSEFTRRSDPMPQKIDRVFEKAVVRRTRGRPGLRMQSRFPIRGRENGVTSDKYYVFQGFDSVITNFDQWLTSATGLSPHGHLFHPDRVEFQGQQKVFAGGLSDNVKIRDYASEDFLINLIWNTRGQHQAFKFGPEDQQHVTELMARDQNAHISVISGAWAVDLLNSDQDFSTIRAKAALLQKTERAFLDRLRHPDTRATYRIWSLAEFTSAPLDCLRIILDENAKMPSRPVLESPKLADLSQLGAFLQKLKNDGMHPYLMGDFPLNDLPRRRYVNPPRSASGQR